MDGHRVLIVEVEDADLQHPPRRVSRHQHYLTATPTSCRLKPGRLSALGGAAVAVMVASGGQDDVGGAEGSGGVAPKGRKCARWIRPARSCSSRSRRPKHDPTVTLLGDAIRTCEKTMLPRSIGTAGLLEGGAEELLSVDVPASATTAVPGHVST